MIIPDAYTLVQLLTGGVFGNGLDDLVAAKTGNGMFSTVHSGYPQALQQLWVHKEGRIGGAAYTGSGDVGVLQSMWLNDGATYSGGVTPSSWVNPTNTTIGALGQASPGGGRSQFLINASGGINGIGSGIGGIIWIYDRLGHCGGLRGTTTGAQNCNGGSAGGITRYGTATNNFLAAEIYSPVGATATTITASYTNQNGTAGQVTQGTQFGGNTVRFQQNSLVILGLASGDTGVQAVTSATLAATTGTAGNFGMVIGQMLAAIVTVGPSIVAHSFVDGPLPQILSGACLAFAVSAATQIACGADLFLEFAEK